MGVKPTFYYYLLKRTHNLGLGSGPNFRWQYIITLYLQGHLTPTIAAKTKPSKEAVDRYIRDYEFVKVVHKATADMNKISQITRRSKRVVSQYLDLIPQHQLQTMDANLANASTNDETTEQGET